jgi:hypothetical protein
VLSVATGSLLYFYFSHVTIVERKTSPDGMHRAKLVRYDGIDVNFEVVVDGEKIFRSADFAPVKYDFREQINWDASGSNIILEVAGQRLFGYNVQQKRKLSDSETLGTKYAPFSEYGFEGLLPSQGQQQP